MPLASAVRREGAAQAAETVKRAVTGPDDGPGGFGTRRWDHQRKGLKSPVWGNMDPLTEQAPAEVMKTGREAGGHPWGETWPWERG